MEIISTHPRNELKLNSIPLIPDDLSVFEKEIVSISIQSDDNPKLRSSDLLSLAGKISNTVSIRMGLKDRGKKENLIFVQTIEADCNKFPDLTEGEVLKFLEMGIDGHFNPDKDFYFTSALFVRWGRTYLETIKKPTMVKHAQLVHQIKDKKIEISLQDRIASASEIANGYADTRRKNPDHDVSCGSGLYQNLENLGLFSIPLDEKKSIYGQVVKSYPKVNEEDLRGICQNIAYNNFIGHLVNEKLKLNESGQLVKLCENE